MVPMVATDGAKPGAGAGAWLRLGWISLCRLSNPGRAMQTQSQRLADDDAGARRPRGIEERGWHHDPPQAQQLCKQRFRALREATKFIHSAIKAFARSRMCVSGAVWQGSGVNSLGSVQAVSVVAQKFLLKSVIEPRSCTRPMRFEKASRSTGQPLSRRPCR